MGSGLFKKMDANNDNFISQNEFISISGKNFKCPLAKDIQAFAKTIDINVGFLINRERINHY